MAEEPRGETVESVLTRNIAAYNAHDLDAYIATFTPSATFAQLGGRILLDSREAMHGYYRQLWETRPTIRCEVKQRTLMGLFAVELQEISGEGQPAMQAMVISEVHDSRIQRVWYTPLAPPPAGSPH